MIQSIIMYQFTRFYKYVYIFYIRNMHNFRQIIIMKLLLIFWSLSQLLFFCDLAVYTCADVHGN